MRVLVYVSVVQIAAAAREIWNKMKTNWRWKEDKEKKLSQNRRRKRTERIEKEINPERFTSSVFKNRFAGAITLHLLDYLYIALTHSAYW